MQQMTEIPPKPACASNMGVLSCACGMSLNCIRARYFWLHVEQVIKRDTPGARNAYVDALTLSRSERGLLRRAVRAELKDRSEFMEVAA